MICKNCGTDNPNINNFCSLCGTTLKSFNTNNNQFAINNNENNGNQSQNNQPNPNIYNQSQNNQPNIHMFNQNQNNNIYPNPYNFNNNNFNNMPKINTYKTKSIVMIVISALLFCCLNFSFLILVPLGLAIASLVFASKCEEMLSVNDIDKANYYSNKAKNFFRGSWISLVVAFVFFIIISIIVVVQFFNGNYVNGNKVPNIKDFENFLRQYQ